MENRKIGSYATKDDANNALQIILDYWRTCRKSNTPIIVKNLLCHLDLKVYINFNYRNFNKFMQLEDSCIILPVELVELEINKLKYLIASYEDGSCDMFMYLTYIEYIDTNEVVI